ncbi:MAG TPA: hypothetical protein VGK74_13230 [Symbiobacteriaceae bacterium]|jgi:hypothetical protein
MGQGQARFRVREIEVADPEWRVDRALDLWRRMLTTHLHEAARGKPKGAKADEEAPA